MGNDNSPLYSPGLADEAHNRKLAKYGFIPRGNSPEEQLDAALDDIESISALKRAELRNAIRKMAKNILDCGDFTRGPDGIIRSDNPQADEWVAPFNEYQGRAPTDSVYAEEAYVPMLIRLYDPVMSQYAGIPNWNGMELHIANGTRHKDQPWIDKFKPKVVGDIHENTILSRPDKMFKECILAAGLPRTKYRQDIVSIGKYLMMHRNANKCKIVKRGSVINRKNNDLVTIYNVKTPHRTFVFTTTVDGNQRKGNDRRINLFVRTIWGCRKFTIEQEELAMEKLKGMITTEQYRQYFIMGTFEEYSPASRTAYFLRRLKPTLAFRRDGENGNHQYSWLAGLCLHPLSYNVSSFAGCQCPTDDVVTHLLWIRGDEHRFWSKANHHEMDDVECGVP